MKQPWFRMKAAPLHLSFAASRIFLGRQHVCCMRLYKGSFCRCFNVTMAVMPMSMPVPVPATASTGRYSMIFMFSTMKHATRTWPKL